MLTEYVLRNHQESLHNTFYTTLSRPRPEPAKPPRVVELSSISLPKPVMFLDMIKDLEGSGLRGSGWEGILAQVLDGGYYLGLRQDIGGVYMNRYLGPEQGFSTVRSDSFVWWDRYFVRTASKVIMDGKGYVVLKVEYLPAERIGYSPIKMRTGAFKGLHMTDLRSLKGLFHETSLRNYRKDAGGKPQLPGRKKWDQR